MGLKRWSQRGGTSVRGIESQRIKLSFAAALNPAENPQILAMIVMGLSG